MEYYSAIKNNKILPFAPTWMRAFEGIMLSKISQTEKDTYNFSYMWNLKKKKKTSS